MSTLHYRELESSMPFRASSSELPRTFLKKKFEMDNSAVKTSGSERKTTKKDDGTGKVGTKRKREPGAFIPQDKKQTDRRRQSGFHVSF